MSNPIRVLQVVTVMNMGGIENLLMNLYRNIDRDKIQFDFVVHESKKGFFDDEIINLGGRIYHAPKYKIYNAAAYKKWWNNFFKSHNEYKTIHSHTYTIASIHNKIAKRFGLTTICHSHTTHCVTGIKGMLKKRLQKTSGDYADYKMACSKEAAEWIFPNDNVNDIIILKNGIDLDKFKYNQGARDRIRKEYGLEDNFIIGHIGSFRTPKNHKFIIEVFADFVKQNPDARLLLLGDGELRNEIADLADELNVSDKVIMTGIVNNTSEYLLAMDCFLFPSLYEGLGIVAIEAESIGMPCFINKTLSKELYINENVYGVSLEKSASEWANFIAKNCKNRVPEEIAKANVAKAGYDINESVAYLSKLYFKDYNGGSE